MKYFLILWVCSTINGTCLSPPITKSIPFNTHYECVKTGYANGLEMIEIMGKKIVEKNRIFVAFNCKQDSPI
jgi:hypothetical protein